MKLEVHAHARTAALAAACLTVAAGASSEPVPLLPGLIAAVVEEGLFRCFEPGSKQPRNPEMDAYCETSSAVFDGTHLIVGSDKLLPCDAPAASSHRGLAPATGVFAVPVGGNSGLGHGAVQYLTAPPFVEARKLEDMTITPDRCRLFATTGFDRARAGHDWDPYNTLMTWEAGAEHHGVAIIAETEANGFRSSVGLRAVLAAALASDAFPDGPPYFKVEGLAALPDDRLLFGVREVGASYLDYTHSIKIVSVPYSLSDRGDVLLGPPTLAYDLDPSLLEGHLQQRIALSSLEYDPFHDHVVLLTSFEVDKSDEEKTDEDVGGHLWTVTLDDIAANAPPRLVRKPDGKPLLLAHKAEAVAVLDQRTLVIVHDDDRVLGRDVILDPERHFRRQKHEAAYTIVELLPPAR